MEFVELWLLIMQKPKVIVNMLSEEEWSDQVEEATERITVHQCQHHDGGRSLLPSDYFYLQLQRKTLKQRDGLLKKMPRFEHGGRHSAHGGVQDAGLGH